MVPSCERIFQRACGLRQSAIRIETDLPEEVLCRAGDQSCRIGAEIARGPVFDGMQIFQDLLALRAENGRKEIVDCGRKLGIGGNTHGQAQSPADALLALLHQLNPKRLTGRHQPRTMGSGDAFCPGG